MRPVLLLIACFALAINAEDTVKDDVKAWIKDFKSVVNTIGKGVLGGEDASTLIKANVNPVTLAELEVFGQLCRPADKKDSSSSSSSEEKGRGKRDAKTSQLEKACVALYKKWPEAQAKFDALPQAAKDAWDAYNNDLATEYQLLKLEILVRWEIFVSDAKCGCDKFKIKLPKLKLKLAKRWKKFVGKMKVKYDDLAAKFGGKCKELSIKFGKLNARIEAEWDGFVLDVKAGWEGFKLDAGVKWEGFKLDAQIGWGRFKADFEQFKIDFNAKLHDWKIAAKAKWEKIKEAFKAAGKVIKHGFEVVGKGIAKGAKGAGKGIGKFFGKIKKGVEHAFSSSSSSSSSSSESCELETFIKNNKDAKAEIHALFNKKA